MQDIYMSIGQSIRRRRKEKHLTQESLATNVETSAQYIVGIAVIGKNNAVERTISAGIHQLFHIPKLINTTDTV